MRQVTGYLEGSEIRFVLSFGRFGCDLVGGSGPGSSARLLKTVLTG
jgi:hypothetical protein